VSLPASSAMKQIVQSYRSGNLEVADVPAPTPASGEVLVRTTVSLVSAGTEKAVIELAKKSLIGKARARPDLVKKLLLKVRREGPISAARAAFSRLDSPVPLGYSCTGVIEALGDGVDGLAVGERVACAGAGVANHAEFNAVPRNLVARVPEQTRPESAAFVTLGAIALHGVRLLEPTLGERILVVGAGLIGQLAAQIVRAAGCSVVVTDPDRSRVDLAVRLGASAGPPEHVDGVLLCSATDSSEPLELAAQACRDRGRIVAVGATGLDVPRRPFFDKELSLRVSRSYGPGRYDPTYEERGFDYPIGYVRWTEGRNLEAFLQLVADGRVNTDALVTHRFTIEQAEQAYRLIREGQEPFMGVLLTYATEARRPVRTVVLPSHVPGARDSVGVAVVGAGSFASSVLVPAIAKANGVRLRVLASGRGLTARHLGLKHAFERSSTSFDEVIDDTEVNAVFIATRHHLHAGQATRALQRGKDVFLEKPPALNREELRHVLDAARDSGRRLTIGYNRRFSPMTLVLHEHFVGISPIVASYRVAAGTLPASHWTRDLGQGGGRLIGEVCHFIDFLTYVIGSMPAQVYAVAPTGSTDEDVAITIRFANGSVGSITYATGHDPAWPKELVEVHGGGRSATLEDFRRLALWSRGHKQVSTSTSPSKGHAEGVAAFIDAIRAGKSSPIDLASIEAVSVATFAAAESMQIGAAVELELESW